MTVRICVIDDDQDILDFFKEVSDSISHARFELITREISELISHLESVNEVDLVIIDINLKQSSGFDLAEYLKEYYPSISIMFMSSYTEYALDGYKFYPIDFLVKPINILRLKSAVELLRNHKAFSKRNNKR